MNQFMDSSTAALSRATDVLFVQNPKGTSLGVFSGVALHGLVRAFEPALHRLADWIDLARVNVAYFIAAGVVLFNAPYLRHRRLPEPVEDAFEVVRRLKKEKVSHIQIKLQYLAIANAVLERVSLAPAAAGGQPQSLIEKK